jgi:hypothetical protein
MQTIEYGGHKKDKVSFEFEDMFSTTDGQTLRNLLADDPWLHPLRFHENVIKDMTRRVGSQVHKHVVYKNIVERICHWDMFMQHVDDGTLPIEYVIYTIRTLPALKKTAAPPSTCEFTKLFSHLSLQKKHEKLLYSDDTGFPWIHAQIFCDYIKYK